jgi:hypothetical protein
MRSSNIKWIVGSVAFFLPTITEIVATSFLNRSLPTAFWTSIVLAAVIPPALVLSSSMKGQILYAFGPLGAFAGAVLFDAVMPVGGISRMMRPDYLRQRTYGKP